MEGGREMMCGGRDRDRVWREREGWSMEGERGVEGGRGTVGEGRQGW